MQGLGAAVRLAAARHALLQCGSAVSGEAAAGLEQLLLLHSPAAAASLGGPLPSLRGFAVTARQRVSLQVTNHAPFAACHTSRSSVQGKILQKPGAAGQTSRYFHAGSRPELAASPAFVNATTNSGYLAAPSAAASSRLQAVQQPIRVLQQCHRWHNNADVHVGAQACTLVRRFATRGSLGKGYNAPPAMHGGVSMNISIASPNQLAEPYSGPAAQLPFLQTWFTPAGWRNLKERFLNSAKSMYTIRTCKKQLPGWSLGAFKDEALKVYGDVCRALASRNQTTLRQLTTGAVFSEMKKELRQQEAAGWSKVKWQLVQPPPPSQMEVVHGRLIYLRPKDDSSAFAQLTVRIPSQQSFSASDSRGRLVAGNPNETFSVTDLWVFEISLAKGMANRWRVAGRLDPTLK